MPSPKLELSTDPQFVDKVRDIVGLYLDPPERAAVLCVDEKSQMRAIGSTAPVLPVLPTTPARMSHDYVRHGTTSLFVALDMASGSVSRPSPLAPPPGIPAVPQDQRRYRAQRAGSALAVG